MRSLRVLAVTTAAFVSLAAPAHAYFEAWYSNAVQVTASGTTVKTYDKRCDGQAAQANYYRGGSTTLYESTNNGGCNTVLQSQSLSTVIQIRACMVVASQPDPCGPWDYTG